MIERSITHATFVLERTYDATPARVFNAFADPVAKARWFVGPEDWDQGERSMDFRVGGREVDAGGPKGGPTSYFEARYQDIVPDQRIVYTYEMRLDGVRISVSLRDHRAGSRRRRDAPHHDRARRVPRRPRGSGAPRGRHADAARRPRSVAGARTRHGLTIQGRAPAGAADRAAPARGIDSAR